MKKIKHILLSSLAFIISFVSISTVNSACMILFGQEEEPKSLKRFKKND